MATSATEISELLVTALQPGFRERLLARGLARSMIWGGNGELPEGAPNFSEYLTSDLLSYGYSVLSLGLRLRTQQPDNPLYRQAFERAGLAISEILTRENDVVVDADFHKLVSAAAFHLGQYSAKAYALLNQSSEDEQFSEMENALRLLILRRLRDLESFLLNWKLSESGTDTLISEELERNLDQMAERLSQGDIGENQTSRPEVDAVKRSLADQYFGALFEFIFALETGNENLREASRARLRMCLEVASEIALVSYWWVIRLTSVLTDDLWQSSFHKVIPSEPDNPEDLDAWRLLRWIFIASLYRRDISEIELWPSQLEGAQRAANADDDLVVSLPTSAGKTRISELCILRCLAQQRRVLFVTPLRALSAQTEASLRRTFSPLGKSVSSLYGSMGINSLERDVMRTGDIVVSTPEKLDFAIRNDPSLLDDVGLVVLDEGHMIGLSEREINYEVQILRLLNRTDADSRRIVCLSAILPDGDQFQDFVDWIRNDAEGSAVQSAWRPTELRYGHVTWHNEYGRLEFTIDEERPFIPNFIVPSALPNPKRGFRKHPFPGDSQELTLATAWNLVDDGHSVLIYCPNQNSVSSFAGTIVDIHHRGALRSLIGEEQDARLDQVARLGEEWFGQDHPIVECLKIGVAIHHGKLPGAYRKEVESLLRRGVLKVIVSSPTLAQGLNLSATAVVMFSLYRNGESINSSEFKNVIGRAGRAFVDTQGLVIFPVFEQGVAGQRKLRVWRKLIGQSASKSMESGLVRLAVTLLQRIARSIDSNQLNDLIQYVANNQIAWSFPELEGETERDRNDEELQWNRHLRTLDTALLSLLGNEEIPTIQIAETLDDILQSSLWHRRLLRYDEDTRSKCNLVLSERARYIWNNTTTLQRKSYYLAGVGFESGRKLDEISAEANLLIVRANGFIASAEEDEAVEAIAALAELIFEIPPFTPFSEPPENWKQILSAWLKGDELHSLGASEVISFIEDALVYRLAWGVDALRVRAEASEDQFLDGTELNDHETGLLVPALESGTLNISAALLMMSGFGSRIGAIQAIRSTNASFANKFQLQRWLSSAEIQQLSSEENWPTPETSELWRSFISDRPLISDSEWTATSAYIAVSWLEGYEAVRRSQVKLWNDDEGDTRVLSGDGSVIGALDNRYKLRHHGIYDAQVNSDLTIIEVTFWGPYEHPFEVEEQLPD